MKILFCPGNCLPFHARTLEERPLGGTETGIIRLAQSLSKLGHEVTVLSRFDNPPLSNPLYIPFSAAERLGEVDLLIAVRDWQLIFSGIKAKKKFFWTGDSYDQIHNFGLGDKRVSSAIDAFMAVSNWHAATIAQTSGFPLAKAFVIGNGVHLPYFAGTEPRAKKRLIYSSTPYRGLRFLPQIFVSLKDKHPDLELHIFSGFDVYAGPEGFHPPAVKEFEELKAILSRLPGCVLRGNVTQRELAREYMRATVLAYPNTFEETSCITAMEAQAGGCPIVTSKKGALPETVADAGVVVAGNPGTPDYTEKFIAEIDRILTDQIHFETLSRAGRTRAAHLFDWDIVAKRFEAYLVQVQGLGELPSAIQASA